ncbi:hypothetical protein COH33_09160 [Neisseria meningitidis]|nr:hypothetical protein COH79_11790 [Neisseria meningitidis]RQL25965.1 hypothetical protein COH33_09160 [Neisseria meningitidis]
MLGFCFWFSVLVGMMGCRFVGMTWCRFPCGWIRHSRAGGNLDLKAAAIFKDYLKVRDSRFPRKWESRM